METKTKSVLVIDDDRFMRRAAEATLRKQGLHVLVAADGEEGLNVAEAEQPDLILLDLIMPKLNGFEVLRRLKENPATLSIPVVIMSALGQESDITQGEEGGARDYIIKTHLSLKDLASKTMRLLFDEA